MTTTTTGHGDAAIVAEDEDTELIVAAVVADMTAAGAFGRGAVLLSYEPDGGRHAGQDQFATIVHYGTAAVDDGRGACRRRLVIKLKHRLADVREFLNNDAQFHNEIHFYERALPSLTDRAPADRVPSLCRYVYGRNDCGRRVCRDAIVLENACGPPLHYRPFAHRLDLDLDHAVAALGTLAKFHALSYRAKHADPATFAEIIGQFKDTQWNDEGQWLIGDDQFRTLLLFYLDRLAERGDRDGGERMRRFRAEYTNNANRALWTSTEPGDGPLTVLCHGDFNRNNLLFRYGGSGRPADALVLDMATVRYGSPALDLSFFLYLNTDRRLRDAHWDRLMDAYCAELAAAVSDAPAVSVPGREQLDAEMRDHAFYGLAHVSFFTRIMMEEHEFLDFNMIVEMDPDNMISKLLTFGGDPATDRVADVLQHFLEVVRYTE